MRQSKLVLVTGAAGSMGAALGGALSAAGHRVQAFDLPMVDFSRLEGLPNVETVKGDIMQLDSLLAATTGLEAVVHLAAILPPASERHPELTKRVNVGGTANLVLALERVAPTAHLIFSSSVSTYGDTTAEAPPIGCDHPQAALDAYAESKVLAEKVVRASSLPYTILRISGVAVPGLLAPPERWPFLPEQRIEFIARDDVVQALAACLEKPRAKCQVFNIAGGRSWQMRGQEYVAHFNKLVGLDPEEARYQNTPGYYDWYDTEESQALLGYQKTSYEEFLRLMQESIRAYLGIPEEEEE